MDDQVNPLERDHTLSVVLPGGLEKDATVHGSKPVMDLLVTLCANYHLNPSDYTVEILSPNKNNISFKPNSPIGSLEAEKLVLKPKAVEEKIRKTYLPEATVRLLINYKKSHKAVVRVNPRVPLELLMPSVCEKCEFRVETTILLRDSQSQEPLDMTKSLNDHGLREVFAKDTAAVTPTEVPSPPPLQGPVEDPDPPKKEKKQNKENKGFLSLFRRRKKKPETDVSVSAPASPAPIKHLTVHSSNTLPADTPKKRPAPQPPMGASQSVPNNLSTHHLRGPQSSAESTLKRTKRRAPPPPPPCPNANLQLPPDTEVQGKVNSLHTLEELRESVESESVKSSPSPSPSSSPQSSPQSPSSSVHQVSSPCLPTNGCAGNELPHARFALAQILTTSLSGGPLLKRLKNSVALPKFYSGASFLPVTQTYTVNGGFCAELSSVAQSNPSTGSDWEDPVQKRGFTTFKVVPSKKPRSYEVELTRDVPDECQVRGRKIPTREASDDAGDNPTETRKDPGSPERSETEIPLPDSELCPLEVQVSEDVPTVQPESLPAPPLVHGDGEHPVGSNFNTELESESLQSPSDPPLNTEMDRLSAQADEKDTEEEGVQQEEDECSFPPPPPPVFYHEEEDDVEEGRGDPVASRLPSSPTCNGQTNAFSGDEPPTAPKPVNRMSTAPSRFAQAVASAVRRSHFHSQRTSMVPDWLPRTSLNGSSCLG